eukprot:m.30340 g.30340  ORF g.30340 m.30340 type:complete len:141 (+) comp8196_c0_seq1:341-763(+)
MRTNVAMSDDTVQEGTKQHVVSAVAKYKFDAENPMELSVSKGDEVSVIETNKKMGWWLCRNSQLLTGYVPASYLTETHEKLEEINIDTHGAVPMSLTTILDNKVAQGKRESCFFATTDLFCRIDITRRKAAYYQSLHYCC